MDPFPLTDEEWRALQDAALAVTNAALAGDTLLRESHFQELAATLAQLRGRYGNHPLLLETLADHTDDEAERVRLYRQAVGVAARHGIITYTIRLSLAEVLLDRGEAEAAQVELDACHDEVTALGDRSDRKNWEQLRRRCSV